MTLARTALRLCVVEALSGTPGDRPTIAQERVYDSRISDLSPEAFEADAKPTIVLLTDKDEGEELSQQNGGAPFRRMIDLVLEIGMTQAVKINEGWIVGNPDTDARLEASLDYLEFQVIRRLSYDPAPMSVLFRRIARIRKAECHRHASDESGVKIAARILVLTCEVSDDQVHIYSSADDQPSGIEALPEPLRSVAAALPDGSSGADVVDAIVGAMSRLTIPALDGIDITVANTEGMDVADMLDVSVEIKNAIDMPQVVAASGSVTIDYAKGTFQNLILAANVTAVSVINWPKNGKTGRLILKITNTGNFTLSGWPNTEWVGGLAPSITLGAGKKDIVVLTTASGGAEVFGNIVGQDYS